MAGMHGLDGLGGQGRRVGLSPLVLLILLGGGSGVLWAEDMGAGRWAPRPGNWEVTLRSEWVGGGGSGGEAPKPVVVEHCYHQEELQPDQLLPRDSRCQLANLQRQGSRTSWTFTCQTEEGTIQGRGNIVTGPDFYQGEASQQVPGEGKGGEFRQYYTGRRLGDCPGGS